MKQISLINSNLKTMVDDEDYDLLMKYSWRLISSGYVARQIRVGDRKLNKRKYIFMHKLIMNVKNKNIIDHKDRNKLNNQKSNLRFSSLEENNRNRSKNNKLTISKYFGVTINNRNNKFIAYITYKGKKLYFGTNHDTDLKAAIAYNKGVEKLNDPFIPLNNVNQENLKKNEKYTEKN